MYGLLHFIDDELAPAMEAYNYRSAIAPVDLIYGLAGCHSNFAQRFEDIAKAMDVDLYRLIVEASKIDQKAPSEGLIKETASRLK